MDKRLVLVHTNGKPQSTILHAPGCELPETSINQVQEGLTKFSSMFAEIFKELDRIHSCPVAATLQHMEEWTYRPHHGMVVDI